MELLEKRITARKIITNGSIRNAIKACLAMTTIWFPSAKWKLWPAATLPAVCRDKERVMTALERMEDAGVLPVVPLAHTADAVPAAKALLAGGVSVMVIPFGTELADLVAVIAGACPEMLVGAGMVQTLEQCKAAAAGGAAFVIMPGYNAEAVAWCREQQLCVIPGCATPTEVMAALAQGVETVGFFPAELYGGLRGLAFLQAAFPRVHFLPAGGIDSSALAEYLCAPGVLAVCGDWLCTRELVSGAQFDQVTALAAQARKAVLGFEIAHGLSILQQGYETARL